MSRDFSVELDPVLRADGNLQVTCQQLDGFSLVSTDYEGAYHDIRTMLEQIFRTDYGRPAKLTDLPSLEEMMADARANRDNPKRIEHMIARLVVG